MRQTTKRIYLSKPTNYIPALDSNGQYNSIFRSLPFGLTVYKNFINTTVLDMNFYCGYPIATFTNNIGNFPVFDANGISIGTTRDDVLSYLIADNRNANEETIIMQFVLDSDLANDGIDRYFMTTNTKARDLKKVTTGTTANFRPNNQDSVNCVANGINMATEGVSYVYGMSCQHSSPYAETYRDGVSVSTEIADDFINPNWGTNFYLGCSTGGASQGNFSLTRILIFNRALRADEHLSIANLLKS